MSVQEVIAVLTGVTAAFASVATGVYYLRRTRIPDLTQSLPAPTRLRKPVTPTMNDCVGQWRWQTIGRSIEFDLQSDGSFTAKNFPNVNGLQQIADGKGDWEVVNGRLTIIMTHVGKLGIWMSHRVVWIGSERITAVSHDEITLAKSKPLRRK